MADILEPQVAEKQVAEEVKKFQSLQGANSINTSTPSSTLPSSPSIYTPPTVETVFGDRVSTGFKNVTVRKNTLEKSTLEKDNAS